MLASRRHGTLYLGVTIDLVRRVHEHKTKVVRGFTSKYGIERLVWFEVFDDPTEAIAREKAIEKWRRDWKVRLIEEQNLDWHDLFAGVARDQNGHSGAPRSGEPGTHERRPPQNGFRVRPTAAPE